VKIAHVIHAFPPESRAGSENYAEALALEQQRRHAVVVFHRVADPSRPEYELRRGRCGRLEVARLNRTFRDLRDFRGTYRSDAVARAFGGFLDQVRPDVVHFHHTTCLSTSCVHEAKRRGIPVVYTLHDFWLLCPRGQLLRRDLSPCASNTRADCVRCMAPQLPAREGAALEEIRLRAEHVLETCSLVDRFVAPTRFLAERYLRFGVPRERLVVSDYGFDLERWRVPRPRAPASRLRAAYLGTWIPSKGVHLLIEAFRGLDPVRASLDVHGYAVPYEGFEDYEGWLRRLAAGAPHIRLRGRYEPEQVPDLLAEADLLVVPSLWYENSPLTVHEAFLAGIPAVVADHGGMRELVEGGGGVGFRPGEVASLRQVLQALADDPSRLERLRASIPPVKGIAENALELERLYLECGASGAEAQPGAPR
jgi:glycosyltransferase involved in cell wall biosynthesis